MRRILVLLLGVAVLAACGSDDDPAADPATDTERSEEPDGARPSGPRFCNAYLDYLSDSTPGNLGVVQQVADDPQVDDYASVISSDADLQRVLAATLDLDDLARERCQAEWIAGTQGAGDTASAAQAFYDALVAGDRPGAQNVASVNAIAVFDPWQPIEADPAGGTPALADVGGESFSIALDPATVATCEVETGVVVACQKTG